MTQMRNIITKSLAPLFSLIIFTANADMDTAEIQIGDRTLTLYAELDKYEIGSQAIIDWVEESATIVANYYGQFPVENASVVLNGFEGGGIIAGRAHGKPVLQVVIEIGHYASQKQLDRDWILIHELIHFALADVPDKHHWLEEGLPTYIESISRIQVGDLKEEFVWKGFMKNMPKGIPLADDTGLDNASSIGRMYWGGALFCLLADIEIRKQTENQYGLRDAVQAIVNHQLTMDKSASINELFQVADAQTGTDVLTNLYTQMKDEPADIDLKAIWSELGINYNNQTGEVSLDDSAPLASVRQSIVSP